MSIDRFCSSQLSSSTWQPEQLVGMSVVSVSRLSTMQLQAYLINIRQIHEATTQTGSYCTTFQGAAIVMDTTLFYCKCNHSSHTVMAVGSVQALGYTQNQKTRPSVSCKLLLAAQFSQCTTTQKTKILKILYK